MNSVETHSLTGAYLQIGFMQMQIAKPWYIGNDRASKASIVQENRSALTPDSFIEYYY